MFYVKRKGKLLFFSLLLLVLTATAAALTSCAAPQSVSDSQYTMASNMDRGAGDSAESAPHREDGYPEEERHGRVVPGETRYIILHGSMKITVAETQEAVRKIRDIADTAKAMISELNIYETRDGRQAAYLVLRVPSANFYTVMELLQELGKAADVRYNEHEVTAQYLDLEARIRNMKAQEERLLEILDMAKNLDEVLTVERELGRIRGEIEVMTTQFEHLQDRVSYSTIELQINEEAIASQGVSPQPFKNLGSRMQQSFVRSINFVLTAVSFILVAFTAALPILAALAVPAAIIWLLVNRFAKGKPPAA